MPDSRNAVYEISFTLLGISKEVTLVSFENAYEPMVSTEFPKVMLSKLEQ